jgi:hypothetical protein
MAKDLNGVSLKKIHSWPVTTWKGVQHH